MVSPDYEYLEAVDPHARWCISGVPRHIYAPRGFQILQTPGLVVIVNEYAHTNRVIPTAGRPHINPSIKLWFGDSRGRWEGNTLIVETTNLNGKAWLAIAGHFTTDAVRVVERFTPIHPDTIKYEATIEDPNVFTRPWTMGFLVVRNKEQGYEHLEDACFEGEDLTKDLTKNR